MECENYPHAAETGNLHIVGRFLCHFYDANRLFRFGGLTASLLYYASSTGQVDCVKKLIQAQADVNLQASDGNSPLIIAAKNGHQLVVTELIRALADVDVQNKSGATALYVASMKGHNEVVQMLIKAQVALNIQQMHGASPLFISVQEGHCEIIKSLINAHADVNLTIKSGDGALHLATQNNFHQVVDMLLVAHAEVNICQDEGASPLIIACQIGHHKMVERLLSAGADANLESNAGFSALHLAAQNGFAQIVKLLIQANADINNQGSHGYSPLYFAAQNGHSQIVNMFIQAQACVDIRSKNGNTPMLIASGIGRNDVVKILIAAQADTDVKTESGFSPLYVASQRNDSLVVNTLVTASADANVQISIGCSPLFVAAQEGYHEVVKALLRAEPNVDLQDIDGVTALYLSVQNGHHQVVQAIIKASADVNLANQVGEVPLHAASQLGHYLIVETLIRAQADINVPQLHGCTPVYLASQNGHFKAADALIRAQADANIQPAACSSPLYVALHGGHSLIAEMLIVRALADVDEGIGGTGESPLHFAAHCGNHRLVMALLHAQADPNLHKLRSGWAPIHAASQSGHTGVVKVLIEAQADVDLRTAAGDSSLSIATQRGHSQVVHELTKASAASVSPLTLFDASLSTQEVKLLQTCSPSSDAELSLLLHSGLTRSGFNRGRAALQSAIADVLQEILRQRGVKISHNYIFVVGSYSEGWGNSLTCVDGQTDVESDIDVMQLLVGRLYHLRGFCKCDGPAAVSIVSYENGHIVCPGFASSPARPTVGSILAQRPAVDEVGACELCCYPPIALLQASETQITESVLRSLQAELSALPCHVVHAAPPGQGGEQLRVSTTFLEKRLLRSLSTVQGQLFVTLKYLVKKVIGSKVKGVKAYHAKTLVFRLLQATPTKQWQPDQLVCFVRRALDLLLEGVENSRHTSDGRIMNHFFLEDAGLYLKGSDQSDVECIAQVLRETREGLPQLLHRFIDTLRPTEEVNGFRFHPFLVLPLLDRRRPPPPEVTSLQYHQIYDVVGEALLQLASNSCNFPYLARLLSALPDCAFTTRECLRAMASMKFSRADTADRILRLCGARAVSMGMPWPGDCGGQETDATTDYVWRHLTSSDSAWQFCLRFDQRPVLSFLPQFLADVFPTWLRPTGVTCYYVNFDALLKCLCLELVPDAAAAAGSRAWFETVAQRRSGEADLQEVLTTLHYCPDLSLQCRLMLSHREMVAEAAATGCCNFARVELEAFDALRAMG